MDSETKKCTACELEKNIKDFHKQAKGRNGYRSWCKSCASMFNREYQQSHKKEFCEKTKRWYVNNREHVLKRSKKYYEEHKENHKRNAKKRRILSYGITLEDYENIKMKQNNLCAICKREEKLFIDHNHTTGKVRGLLCRTCNGGLGYFYENIEALKTAIAYLKEYNI